MEYIIPTIIDEQFFDGIMINANKKCPEKYKNEPCKSFYAKLCEKPEGIYQCPSGYTVYHKKKNGKSVFYVGMCVKKHYLKKKNNETSVILSEQFFNDIIKAQDKYINLQEELDQNIEIHKDLLHDVRKLDSLVKSKSEMLIKEYSSEKSYNIDLLNKIKNINAMEELIAKKYSVYDLVSNFDVINIGTNSKVNIYKKFDKVRYILLDYKSKSKGKSIVFEGETTYEYNININYADILPFLLLENAIKYTIGEKSVIVKFDDINGNLFINITSFGPYCEEDEREKIFQKNYRGKNTGKIKSEGTGIGLYLAKQICAICDIDITVKSEYVKDINGVRCGYFTVNLIF